MLRFWRAAHTVDRSLSLSRQISLGIIRPPSLSLSLRKQASHNASPPPLSIDSSSFSRMNVDFYLEDAATLCEEEEEKEEVGENLD